MPNVISMFIYMLCDISHVYNHPLFLFVLYQYSYSVGANMAAISLKLP